jgi:hypothetical protein
VDIGPEQYAPMYAVITVALLMLVVSVRKGVIDMRDGVTRCPACGRLHRHAKPCPCATRHHPLG